MTTMSDREAVSIKPGPGHPAPACLGAAGFIVAEPGDVLAAAVAEGLDRAGAPVVVVRPGDLAALDVVLDGGALHAGGHRVGAVLWRAWGGTGFCDLPDEH